MSVYKKTQTIMSEEKHLVAALQALGYKPQVHQQPVTLTDYHNNRVQATVVIPKANEFGTAWSAIGFNKVNGVYDACIDDFDRDGRLGRKRYDDRWLGAVAQGYQESQTMTMADEMGYIFQGREVVDGEIKLVFAERSM